MVREEKNFTSNDLKLNIVYDNENNENNENNKSNEYNTEDDNSEFICDNTSKIININNEEDTNKDEDDENSISIDELLEEESKSLKLKILRSVIPLVMVIGMISLVYGLYNVIAHIVNSINSTMPTSHIYVCDDPNTKNDFDNWLSDDLELNWVPTYLVIKNNQVLGAFPGDIPVDEFTSNLTMCILLDSPTKTLPNTSITNIDGKTNYLSNIFKNTDDIYILEIHWIDCKDCIHQDDNYTNDIYETISTKNIYRYYVKSDKNKVVEKYNN